MLRGESVAVDEYFKAKWTPANGYIIIIKQNDRVNLSGVYFGFHLFINICSLLYSESVDDQFKRFINKVVLLSNHHFG